MECDGPAENIEEPVQHAEEAELAAAPPEPDNMPVDRNEADD